MFLSNEQNREAKQQFTILANHRQPNPTQTVQMVGGYSGTQLSAVPCINRLRNTAVSILSCFLVCHNHFVVFAHKEVQNIGNVCDIYSV